MTAKTTKSSTTKKPTTKTKVVKPPIPEVKVPQRSMELDEIKNLEEPLYRPRVEHVRKGRPKNTNFLSYEDAKEFVQGELIPSRNKYMEWFARHKPKAIPRFPYRVYKEWTSWNDFLGTENTFGQAARVWRPLDEAAMFVNTLKLESYIKWMEYCKTKQLPEDIPTRPDLVYAGWKSWNHWLGNKPADALNVLQQAIRNQIYYIIHEPGVPENVFTFGLETNGPTAFKERISRDPTHVIRLFWYDPNYASLIKGIIEGFSTPYLGSDKQRICQNMWEINYRLENLLTRITKL